MLGLIGQFDRMGYAVANNASGSVDSIWTPDRLSGLAAWYDADDTDSITITDGRVSRWADKAGRYDAVKRASSSLPSLRANSLAGKSVVRFQNNLLAAPSALGSTSEEFTVAFVSRENKGSNNVFISLNGSNFSWQNRVLIHAPWSARRQWFFDLGHGHSNRISTSSHVTKVNEVVMAITGKSVTGNINFYRLKGGAVVGQRANPTAAKVSGGLLIGAGATDHDLGEIIIFRQKLTDNEITKTEGYLAHKWGLQANLPDSHPYKSDKPTIVE